MLDIGPMTERLQAVVRRLEPAVLGLAVGDHAALALIRGELAPFHRPLAAANMKLADLRLEYNAGLRRRLGTMIGDLNHGSLAVGVIMTAALFLFGFEALRARRAERTGRRREAHVRFLAHHDPLTGLVNRSLLRERLISATGGCEPDQQVCLLALDLDGFKPINDTFGHAVGDRLLQVVAARLQQTVKSSDTVGRLGGDEFAIVVTLPNDPAMPLELADRLLAAIRTPIMLDDQQLQVGTSIGIASFPTDAAAPEALLRCADLALYEAKASGRRTFCVFSAKLDQQRSERQALEAALAQALANNELDLAFQPQIELAQGRIFGVEALVRWHHPQLGPIPPPRFIEIAESSGLILELGSWVLEQACTRAAAWPATADHLRISVNLSPLQISRPGLEAQIERVLAMTGLAPERLILEITEGVLMHDTPATLALLGSLRRRGIQLAIDDFGTGYSSLSYLKRFAIDFLKIDQAFIQDIEHDEEDRAIIRGIVGLAQTLGLRIVAEGVETTTQHRFIETLGCQIAQGYYYSEPISETALLALLAAPASSSRRSA